MFYIQKTFCGLPWSCITPPKYDKAWWITRNLYPKSISQLLWSSDSFPNYKTPKKKKREGEIGHKTRPQRNKFSIPVFGWRVLPETIWVKNPGKRENGRGDFSRKSCVHTCAWARWEQFLTLLIMVPFLFFLIHHPLSGEDFTACSLSFLFFS